MDFTTLTDEEVEQLRIGILTELERRQALAQIPDQIRDLTTKYLAGGGRIEDLQTELPAE